MVRGNFVHHGRALLNLIALGVTAAALLLCPSSAEACVECVVAFGDLILPPIGLWTLLSAMWLFVLAACRYSEKRPILMPSLKGTILLMVVAFFLAAFGGGPFPFLLLLPPTIVMSIQILLDGFGKKKAVFPRSARVIAGIGFAVFVVLTVKTVTIHATRSPVDLVLKWNSAASPKRIIGDLVLRGREALPELRRIIAEGGDIAVSSTVDILAEYGEAEWSVPLLIEVMEEREDYSQHVQSRLREVTGLELSKSSSATEWKLAWQKRLEEERTPPPLSVGK